jgi:spore coat protein CotF
VGIDRIHLKRSSEYTGSVSCDIDHFVARVTEKETKELVVENRETQQKIANRRIDETDFGLEQFKEDDHNERTEHCNNDNISNWRTILTMIAHVRSIATSYIEIRNGNNRRV